MIIICCCWDFYSNPRHYTLLSVPPPHPHHRPTTHFHSRFAVQKMIAHWPNYPTKTGCGCLHCRLIQNGRTLNPLTLWTVPVLVRIYVYVRVWVHTLDDLQSVQLRNATTTTTTTTTTATTTTTTDLTFDRPVRHMPPTSLMRQAFKGNP